MGAQYLFDWLLEAKKPFVFLSNSGAKGPKGAQAKLFTNPYKISNSMIDVRHFYTAAVSVAKFLEAKAPPGSSLYFIQSVTQYGNTHDSCIKAINDTIPHLFSRYQWRTDLSEQEAKLWAVKAKSKPGMLLHYS